MLGNRRDKLQIAAQFCEVNLDPRRSQRKFSEFKFMNFLAQ